MKKETKSWLDYAEENLKSADVLLQSNLFNPCLQSIQQAIEKYLKAILLEKAIGLAKSHSIRHLVNILSDHNITINILEDDIDLIDSVYMPSRYPVVSVLPNFVPDRDICEKCLRIASEVKNSVIKILKN